MDIRCTRKVEWDMAHRVASHDGKCRHLHGHRYVAEVSLRLVDGTGVRPFGAEAGMVADFGNVKAVLGALFVDAWDHALMLSSTDPLVAHLTAATTPRDTVRLVTITGTPTAEVLADYILRAVSNHYAMLSTGITVDRVRVYETPNCWADAVAEFS
jgi:6-pyruvoyltetrahydropterin/6-carboxytetrahydropterin synthase